MSRWVFGGLVCGRWDSNPHALRRPPLKMVRLPVPPLPHEDGERILAGSDRQGKSNVAPKKLPPRWASEGSQEWFPSAQRNSRSYQPTTFWQAVEKAAPAKETAVAAAPKWAGPAAGASARARGA